MASEVNRQATAAFDRAFQSLFTLVSEVVALYRQREAIDGSSGCHPMLQAVPPSAVEERLRNYKVCFDTTGPDVHVDMVLELYSKVRGSLQRGYQCDSWLGNGGASFYYGVSMEQSGQRVVHLDCVFLMLESLKRADSVFRDKSAVMRIRFSYLLYSIFIAALRYAQLAEGETNVRGVTPEVSIDSDVKVLEAVQTETLNDLPKPAPPPQAAAAPGPGGLASLFSGGMGDIASSLLKSLPGITRIVTESAARATGTAVSSRDQEMIDSTMNRITSLLQDPSSMQSAIADLANGPDGINRFVQNILTPAQQEAVADSAEGAPAIAPPAPPGDGSGGPGKMESLD